MARGGAILGGALVIRLLHHALVSRTACLAINRDPISDMEAFHQWAMSVIAGDWLGQPGFHPFHPWQSAIASEATWTAWYGPVFHQEPFYPYLIALLYGIFGPGHGIVLAFQAILGAIGCAAIYLGARRAAGERAAIAAGCLAAIYGPFLFYESLLLRDTILIGVHALLIWTLLEALHHRADPRDSGGRAGWWLATGLLGGISFITKASIAPFLAVCGAFALRGPRRLHHGVSFAAGFLAVLLPLIARNAAVGAPAMKITTRGAIEFINGNNPWHPGTGWFDGDDARVSAYARNVMTRTEGRLFPAVGRVISDWSDRPGAFLALQARKAGYFFAPFEMPNNASYAYFRTRVALLRLLPGFLWIAPFALLGLIVALIRRDLRERTLPVLLFLLLGIVLTLAFYVIARFRAPLMPAVLVFAGLGLSEALRILSSGSGRERLAAAALIGIASILLIRADHPDRALVRPQDYLIAIDDWRQRGRTDRALAEAEEGREIFPGFSLLHREAGILHADLGNRDRALAALREALRLDPRDPLARREYERLQRAP